MSKKYFSLFLFYMGVTALLSGCTAISNWADSVGSHMPTIGEPCYNWQCMTESGQKKSAEIKQGMSTTTKQAEATTQKQDTEENHVPVAKDKSEPASK